MRCLQSLLLFCLMSAVHCHPSSEADLTGQVKREDEVSVDPLQTLVQKQASTINKQQAKLLTAYKIQLDSYKNQLDSYKNQLNSVNNRLDAYENRLDNQAGSYKNQVDAYRNQFDSYKNQFDSYKSQVDSMDTQLQMVQRKEDAASKSVAFTARIAASHDSVDYGLALGHHQIVVFDVVVTNIGNAYNHNTGIFAAPVNGTYVFFLNQMNPNKQTYLYLAIVKNGAVLGMVFTKEGAAGKHNQGTSQVSTHLTAGDQVWVRQHLGTGVRGDWWTVFTGFLLHAE